MIDPQLFVRYYGITRNVLYRQLEGVTHEESLLQLPFRGNCMNWVVGHLVESRCHIMKLVGLDPIWDDAMQARYANGSEPIIGEGEGVFHLEKILDDFQVSQDQLVAALGQMTVADMEKVVEGSERAVGDRLLFFYFHESYHVGQLEYLRQLAGKNDKVI